MGTELHSFGAYTVARALDTARSVSVGEARS